MAERNFLFGFCWRKLGAATITQPWLQSVFAHHPVRFSSASYFLRSHKRADGWTLCVVRLLLFIFCCSLDRLALVKCWNWNGHAAANCDSRRIRRRRRSTSQCRESISWRVRFGNSIPLISTSSYFLALQSDETLHGNIDTLLLVHVSIAVYQLSKLPNANISNFTVASESGWFATDSSNQNWLCFSTSIHLIKNLIQRLEWNHVVQRSLLQQLLARQLPPSATGNVTYCIQGFYHISV